MGGRSLARRALSSSNVRRVTSTGSENTAAHAAGVAQVGKREASFDDVSLKEGAELALAGQQEIVERLPVERGGECGIRGRQDRHAVRPVQVTAQTRSADCGLERRHNRDPGERHVGGLVRERRRRSGIVA